MEQLSLFDEMDQALKREKQIITEALSRPTYCIFCNETITTPYWGTTNHGIVFNGWCMKALVLHTRNQGQLYTSEAKWLQHLGIDPNKNKFDERHWNLDNVAMHFEKHFGNCYGAECRGL